MARNPYRSAGAVNKEWGRGARKEEASMRGLSHTADRSAIAEQLAEIGAEEFAIELDWPF